VIHYLKLVILFFGSLLSSLSFAADKWSIGFNEPFISGYMKSKGHWCAECPTNTYQADATLINSRILDLASQRHVGAFREIIPLAALRPSSTTNHYDDAIDIISIYSNYNLKLTLTFGLPIPLWMSPTGSTWTPMPASDQEWATLKNALSLEMGNLVQVLWNSPRVNRTWMKTHLFIEGFNEFDSLQNTSGSTANASPARAADLQNGIQWYLNLYGTSVQTLMPSVVGAYTGYGTGVADSQAQYIADYYQLYGTGLPNAHIYVRNDFEFQGYADLVNKLRSRVLSIDQALPTALKGKLVIGETGAADRVPPNCTAQSPGGSLDIAQRDSYYAAIAFDSEINSRAGMILFWRLMNLPANQLPSCEAYFGVVHDDNSGYKAVGLNLFNYLGN
jgi:hypothetical protein